MQEKHRRAWAEKANKNLHPELKKKQAERESAAREKAGKGKNQVIVAAAKAFAEKSSK